MKRRRYVSPLRVEQARATEDRILAAATELLRVGRGELTIPALAREARVSVPTVNRYFPSRGHLLRAVVARIDAERAPPRSLADFLEDPRTAIREMFDHFERASLPHHLAFAPGVMELRKTVTIPRRRKLIEDELAKSAPNLPPNERALLTDALVVLLSSGMYHLMTSYLDVGAGAAADRVAYVCEQLWRKRRPMPRPPSKRTRP